MYTYETPKFDFSAPVEFAARREVPTTKSQCYRSEFMRDRDRIMYCGAFRRLAGKTQIYLAGKDDNQRNRLTHTLEVSQIARTISHALGLDCDLTEAIALGHDLGHAPFGHAGEQTLHEIMVPSSPIQIKESPMLGEKLAGSNLIKESLYGFKHNVQSVRIAASVEDNYGKNGLNLTNYTLWGFLHHSSVQYKEGRVETKLTDPDYRKQYDVCYSIPGHPGKEAWSFEAFVVGEADEIAQWHHDMEDAIRGGAMTGSDVCKAIQSNLKDIMSPEDASSLKRLMDRKLTDKKYISDLSHIVVNSLVNRLIESSIHNLNILWEEMQEAGIDKTRFFLENDWTDKRIQGAIKLNKLDEPNKKIKLLEENYPSIISEKIHHSRDVERMNAKGQYIIKKLFQAYYRHPQQLPNGIILRYMVDIGEYASLQSAENAGIGAVRIKFEKMRTNENAFVLQKKIALMRKICDHIAGMTDHYAIEEYNNLYG